MVFFLAAEMGAVSSNAADVGARAAVACAGRHVDANKAVTTMPATMVAGNIAAGRRYSHVCTRASWIFAFCLAFGARRRRL